MLLESMVYNGVMEIGLTVWCDECRQLGIYQWVPLAEIREGSPARVFKLTKMSQQEQGRYNNTFYALTANPELLYPRRIVYGAQMISSEGPYSVKAVHYRFHRIGEPHYLDAMPLKCKNDHYLVLSYAAAVAILERCQKTRKTNVHLKKRLRPNDRLALCEIAPEAGDCQYRAVGKDQSNSGGDAPELDDRFDPAHN